MYAPLYWTGYKGPYITEHLSDLAFSLQANGLNQRAPATA